MTMQNVLPMTTLTDSFVIPLKWQKENFTIKIKFVHKRFSSYMAKEHDVKSPVNLLVYVSKLQFYMM